MKKVFLALLTAMLVLGVGLSTVYAAPSENSSRTCTDGRDNDKDGDIDCNDQDCIDAGFCGGGGCSEGETQPTSCGVGECAGNTGIETCDANGNWVNDTCDPFAGATTEICDDLDNNCDGSVDENLTQPTTCGVGECAGNTGEETCTAGVWGNDTCDPFAGATTEICDDTLDNDCDGDTDGDDADCGAGCVPVNTHDCMTEADYPGTCMTCHDGGSAGDQYTHAFNSVHYQWKGDAPDMVGGPAQQGKIFDGMNTYCINILGNWGVCGTCHAGRGVKPGSGDTKANVDCLMCHNEEYTTARTRLGDGSMGPATPTDSMYNNPQPPTTTNCLQCHAKGGGANGVKRGDLALELKTNTDPNYDVHMNTASSNLQCIDCHALETGTDKHKISGRGSDLRPTDSTIEAKCTNCHTGMDSGTGHQDAGANRTDADRHVARVSCQACHISTYGKNPTGTETHRIWRTHHNGDDAVTCEPSTPPCPGHPDRVDELNLTPTLAFWNGKNDNYLLGEVAVYDTVKDTYQTSVPVGDINEADVVVGGKLYPFKYKTSEAPISQEGMIIAVDTWEYLKVSGNINTAVNQGVTNMVGAGISIADPNTWTWGTSDTYQLITHGVEPAATVTCESCHTDARNLDPTTSSRLDQIGYALKDSDATICAQCHRYKSPKTNESMHNHLNKGSGIDCLFCHTFTRPERGLCSPCDPACVSEFVDGTPFDHSADCQ